ncbi:MAG: mandelate racemase/muconate lactonizing enzyme family protein [Verrucomicrobiales bacterium]|nr:mandelate racemase/muconate lactonizing enzyme family protein [Verrucomicrobiales bacterium]
MADPIKKIEVYIVDLSQEKPYLGDLKDGESVNDAGYFVRKGNRTVYPKNNRSIVVRVTTKDGVKGWGETYGIVAPKATAEIILDLLSCFIIGRDPLDRESIHDELYDLMRVRGYTGGFYLDALAAVDIALWDITGKISNLPLSKLLGGQTHAEIPAYVSGLPENNLEKRGELALSWQSRGFNSFKFALPAADQGPVKEISHLRNQLGDSARIACDLHWAYSSADAVKLAYEMIEDRPWFLEAPVPTEDIAGLRQVAQNSVSSIAVGEEWRTVFDARVRIDQEACHIVQPEMGHTGVTQFMRIGRYAEAHHLEIIPHATIGSGIFLAASLQASAALKNTTAHEFQHFIFEEFQHFTGKGLACEKGFYQISDRPGIGVEPSAAMKKKMELVGKR